MIVWLIPSRQFMCASLVVIFSVLAGTGGDGAELLIFEQPACPFCAAFNREIAPDYPQSRAGRIAPLRHVNIHKSRTGGIEGLDPAVFTPTFVLVEKGREVGRLLGYPGRRYFYPEIQLLLDKLPPAPKSAAAPVR